MLPKNLLLHRERKRKRTYIEIFKNELQHFCEETNLHGWKFLVLKRSTILDR